MVYTRNQKRKFDDLQTNDSNIDNLQIDSEFSNIKKYTNNRKNTFEKTKDDTETSNIDSLSVSESESLSNLLSESSSVSAEIYNPYSNIITQSIQHIFETFIKSNLNKGLTDNETSETEDTEQPVNDEYDKYIKYIDTIHNGDFFTRTSIDKRKSRLKSKYTTDEIHNMNEELERLKETYKSNAPNVSDILNMNINSNDKQQMLERIYQYTNSDVLTPEYNVNLKSLISNIKEYENTDLRELEREIIKSSEDIQYSENYKEKILRSKMSYHNKIISYKRLEVMNSFEATDTSEYSKYKAWMDILLSIPYDQMTNNNIDKDDVKSFIKNVRTVLDKRLSFLERPKDQVINIVTQMIRNPNFSVNAIGLHGPKGVGKTCLVKSISEALGRPYRTISLGGESDSSLLTGHGFTYVGSCPGRIIEILRETKCSNPIILFDELDKVSETHHGKEIIGNLIHLTDSSTNNKYNYDKYFSGLEIDLSKVLFIFTYNDASKIDPILADRLFKIKVDNYSIKEKMEITKTHLITTILNEYNFTNENIQFEESAINHIVESSKSDQGMRDIKRKFEIIISRVNTLLLTEPDEDIVRLKYKMLYSYYKQGGGHLQPVKILREHIDIFLSESINEEGSVNSPPPGMYI